MKYTIKFTSARYHEQSHIEVSFSTQLCFISEWKISICYTVPTFLPFKLYFLISRKFFFKEANIYPLLCLSACSSYLLERFHSPVSLQVPSASLQITSPRAGPGWQLPEAASLQFSSLKAGPQQQLHSSSCHWKLILRKSSLHQLQSSSCHWKLALSDTSLQ